MRSSARRVLRSSVRIYPSLPRTARWPEDSAAPACRLPPAPVGWMSAHSKPDDQAGASTYSWPLRNFKPALHRRSRKAALQPGRDVSKAIERHEFACAVKADQIAHPAEQRDVGDGLLVVHHPPPSAEASLHHPEQARGFGNIALKRPLVGDLLAGEFVEKADLTEHRSDPAHLEVHPLDGFVSARRIVRQQLSSFLGEILQDRPGFEQPERLAIRSIRIEDSGDLAVRVQRQEFRRLLVVLVEVDEMHFVRQPDLLQHDRHLDAVWRRKRIELKAVRIFCGPACGDRKGGKVGHDNSFYASLL